MICLSMPAGVTDLQREDADKGMASTYALLVADTVLVSPEDQPAPEKEADFHLTHLCPKNWTDVAYFFKVPCNTSPPLSSQSRGPSLLNLSNMAISRLL